MATDPEAAERLFKDAVSVLNGPVPDSSAECGFCRWNSGLKDWERTPRLSL
jgi:hypothetical protein